MAGTGTDPGYQHDREQLTLPEPASGLWNRIRTTVHALGRRRPDERIEPRIGGGTTLAARWRHRASTDIDITGEKPVEIPIGIGATDVRRHLTGLWALNIPNAPLLHGGDWHQCCGWFTDEPDDLQESAYTNEREHGELLGRLGGIGLRDARAGLRRLGHPAGDGETKVWAATYDRAVLETAWAYVQNYGARDMMEGYKPIDTRELARWLPYPHQWVRLHALAWLLRNDLDGEVLAKWDNWRHSWTPRA